jgi:hypothetical protein
MCLGGRNTSDICVISSRQNTLAKGLGSSQLADAPGTGGAVDLTLISLNCWYTCHTVLQATDAEMIDPDSRQNALTEQVTSRFLLNADNSLFSAAHAILSSINALEARLN